MIQTEDRAIYYSHSLANLPENYTKVISEACSQNTDSEEDYFRREKIFMENIVSFIEKLILANKWSSFGKCVDFRDAYLLTSEYGKMMITKQFINAWLE